MINFISINVVYVCLPKFGKGPFPKIHGHSDLNFGIFANIFFFIENVLYSTVATEWYYLDYHNFLKTWLFKKSGDMCKYQFSSSCNSDLTDTR